MVLHPRASRIPAVFAVLSGAALLYADAVAPLVLSPQTGWHFASAVRWVWLAFAAAGAAKGLLVTTAALRAAAAAPSAKVKLSMAGASLPGRTQAERGAKAAAAEAAPPIEAAGNDVAPVATDGEPKSAAARGPDPETLPAFNSAAAQHLVLKGLAVLSCVAASAAAAAPRVVRRLGGMLVYGKDHEGSLVDRWLPIEGGPQPVAALLAALGLGPLFWSLGFIFAAALTQHLLSGGMTRARRAVLFGVLFAWFGYSGAVYLAAHPDVLPPAGADLLAGFQVPVLPLPLPPQPAASVLAAIAAAFAFAAQFAQIWLLTAAPPTSLREMAAQRRRGRGGALGALQLLVVAWLAIVGNEVVKMTATAHGLDKPFKTTDGKFNVVWRGEAASGERLAVVEGEHMSAAFRVLRAGHSILGGIYFEPEWFANQSIYDVFYIHEGVRLATASCIEARHSLHIGLGVGVASGGLAAFGESTDVIELNPEVVHLAEKHFGWRGNGTVLAWDAAEAVPYALDEENPPLYDHIIHDVFSGGAVPRRLLSQPLLGQVHRLLAPHGVAAFNFYGDSDGPPARAFAARLHAEFGHVRCFAEASRVATRNLVYFVSSRPLRFRSPVPADDLENGARHAAMDKYFRGRSADAPPDNGTTLNGMERDMGWVEGLSPREAAELQREAEGPAGGASDADAASHHWAVMRTVFSSVFWSQTY